MKYTKLLWIMVFILSINSVLAIQSTWTTFNNSLTEERMSLDSDQLRYLDIYQNANIYIGNITLTGTVADVFYTCFQEQVNSTVECGLDTGYYFNWYSTPLANFANLHDGNESTYASASGYNIVYFRYYKPPNAQGMVWYMFDSEGKKNITVPSTCWGYSSEYVEFRWEFSAFPASYQAVYGCRHPSGGYLTIGSTYNGSRFYEEGAYWNVTNTTAQNVTLKVGSQILIDNENIDSTTLSIPENVTTCLAAANPCVFNFSSAISGQYLNYSDMIMFRNNYSYVNPSPISMASPTQILLNITYNNAYIDPIECNMTINGTVYEMTPVYYTNYTVCGLTEAFNQSGTFPFNFTYNLNDDLFTTANDNLTIISAAIDGCDGSTYLWPIVNFTYFDENTNEAINASNAYSLFFYDGSYTQNVSGVWANNYSDTLCTDLNASQLGFNWEMYGTVQLSKDEYITRIVSIDSGAPIVVSNNPPTNVSMFLIGISNSSTMTYTWLTTTFELIDGTMRIFKCNDDGSQDLVESTPIISGVATANIELLTQAYSYDVIIDGTAYTGGFTTCHIESTTSQTYYVDTLGITITDLVGLSGIPCDITQNSNTSYTFAWGANPEDSSFVSACIEVYNNSGSGNQLLYSDCSTYSQYQIEGYTHTFSIPAYSDYVVYGKLVQGDNYYTCFDTYSVYSPSEAQVSFGLSGLIGLFLLVVALALFFAQDGEMQLVGAGVGLIAGFFLALSKFSWITTASALAFLIIIFLVGRHSRVKS